MAELRSHLHGMRVDLHRMKSRYHSERLKGADVNIETVAAEMRRHTATANAIEWFAAWDSEAAQRAQDMEREVGLAPGPVPSEEFLAAARRAIVFELGGTLRRTALASVVAH